jgi:hypothetical protein
MQQQLSWWQMTSCLFYSCSSTLSRMPPVCLQQLDAQMHKMMLEKQQRLQQMKEDSEAIAKLDSTISTHIKPNMVSHNSSIYTAARPPPLSGRANNSTRK